jgi:hypothetical protein
VSISRRLLRRIHEAPVTAPDIERPTAMTTAQLVNSTAVAASPVRYRALRSVGAVLAGLVATFVVTTAIDTVLHATGVYPPFGERMGDALFVLALAYRIPLNVGGSFLAARLAPDRPLRHALALGVVGVILATVGAIAMGSYGPGWYSVANIVIALPCAYVGGKWVAR